MDSLFESMIDPAERRRTQNRLAKRKSRTHARKPGTEAPELLAMSQPVEAPKSEEPGARETGNAAVGHHTTSSFASSSSTQLPTMVSPSVDIVYTRGFVDPPGAVQAVPTPPLEDGAEDYSHTTSPFSASEGRSQIWHSPLPSEDIQYAGNQLDLYPSTLFHNLTPSSSRNLAMPDSNAIVGSTSTSLAMLEGLKDNPSMPGAKPGSPLHIASAMGHVKVAKTLITYGANVNEVDAAGFSPIHYATRNNHTTMVLLLLEHGADIYSLDPEGCTPLYRASQSGNNDLVERLLKHGAQVC